MGYKQPLQQGKDHSEELLRATMESIRDFAIITMDKKRVIKSWNVGAENMFGYKESEIVGKTADIIFTKIDRENDIPAKEQTAADMDGRAMDERWHLRKDGSEFFMSGVMVPMRSNIMSGYVKVGRDLTDKVALEQRKDEFIAIASHELSTPVTSIKSYTELLHDMFINEKEHKSKEIVEKLDKQVSRLTGLVKNLLDVTKITEGHLKLEKTDFDINELIREVVKTLQETTTEHNLQADLTASNFVYADYERISQVLTNLISNAIKYSPKPGNIVISSTSDESSVKVCVKDPGIGIVETDMERIFDRYHRATDSKHGTYKGLGLGLFITRNIVTKHGGNISVKSEEGKGATFCFTLPHQT